MNTKILKTFILCVLMLLCTRSVSAEVTTKNPTSEAHESIFVAGNPDFYPIEYYDEESGQFEGVMPKVLNAISTQTGINFTYIYDRSSTAYELAQNSQVEMISSYITDNNDAFVADKYTVTSYAKDGKNTNLGFAFTSIADKETVSTIKAAASKIAERDINGYFMSTISQSKGGYSVLLIISILCCILFTVIIVLSAIRIKNIQKQSKINKMTDPETGIGNLLYFVHSFENSISDFSRSLYHIAYIIIDSNYLQLYHSESTFTDVIKYTAGILTSYAKNNEIAARITENGFAFAFQSTNAKDAKQRINEIIKKLNKYTDIDEKNTKPVFHAAIYNLNISDHNCEYLLFNLRRNCYKIIGTELQTVYCDTHLMNSAMEEKKILENITNGFKNKEFKLYLQFVVDNKSKKIISAEGLSRWDSREKGILTPAKYIEAMESSGLIKKLDFYMLEKVCKQLQKWRNTEFADLTLSCNFTRITLSEDDFIDTLKSITGKYNFDKSKLIIEITEDAIEKNLETAKKNVYACKDMGFKIALDDLGSGYTSLSNLCDYPIDIVKIDRGILLKTDKKNGKELFKGMIALAHSLNLKVVCEGVETDEQDKFVSESDCNYIQGWHYSRVFPISEAENFARKYTMITA